MLKKTAFSTLSFFFLLVIFANETIADESLIAFQVSNHQTQSLGSITISTLTTNYYLAVPQESISSIGISETAVSTTINGQIVPQGVNAYVTLLGGKVVGVIWLSPNSVVIIDRDEIG